MDAILLLQDLRSPSTTSAYRTAIFQTISQSINANTERITPRDAGKLKIQRYLNLVPYFHEGLLDVLVDFLSISENYPEDVSTQSGQEVRPPDVPHVMLYTHCDVPHVFGFTDATSDCVGVDTAVAVPSVRNIPLYNATPSWQFRGGATTAADNIQWLRGDLAENMGKLLHHP